MEFLSAMTPLSGSLKAALDELLVRESYRPHQVIHAAGHTENRCWFIETGFVRTYYPDAAGKEHTLNFYIQNEIVWSNQGYWNEAVDHYLEVLEPSVVWSLTYKVLHQLHEAYPESVELVQQLIRHQYHEDLQKNRLLAMNAETRYRELRRWKPELFRRASVRLIASYLNMTRENLSRLISRKDR